MRSPHRKTLARAASVIAAAGLVAALTSAPATAQLSAAGAPSGTAAAVPFDSDIVPMNFAINAYEIRDGETARTFKKSTRAVKKIVLKEGGTILRSYPKIGVVIAYTEDKNFDDRLRDKKYSDKIESLGATRTSPTSLPDLAQGSTNKTPQDMLATPKIDPEPREGEQWGNTALESLKANEIQPGSKDVLVGDLDSGIQSDHEDLAAAIDKKASVDCTNNGIENTDEAAWNPTTSTHGTHTAGTIVAQRNGIGVAGIAPGVKIASIKVGNDDGFIFPEYAICGFMWAPKHGVDVTNNSYYIDPWLFMCPNDPEQGPVLEAVSRAIAWTEKKGIVNVAAAGNASYDLANKTTDSSSPDDSTPEFREVNNKCLEMPAELPGVVAVSATTEAGSMASFSNFGDGVIDAAGPGSSVLSTIWPDSYGFLSGTSMASPHVAGVAALIMSEYPDLTPKQVRQRLYDTSVDVPCPPDDDRCTGDRDYNGFFGNGLVNALDAVTVP